jgi:enterochelin esterase-like enzyme
MSIHRRNVTSLCAAMSSSLFRLTGLAVLAMSAHTLFAEGTVLPPPPQPPSIEIAPDGKVSFRCRAPHAKEVKASGQFGADILLTAAEEGWWKGTSAEPVAPGVYEYRFIVDGLSVIDAQNPAIKPQRWPGTSILHLPATPPALWDLREVPHGTLHTHGYRATTLGGAWRELVVYTPPGYGKAGAGPFPTLYLSHGFSDNQGSWSAHGKAHWILDNLIAEGKAAPMVIVMPDAHSLPPGPGWKDDYANQNTDAFCQEMIKDVIPMIEANYTVKKEAKGRAFAGLSMGGRHALTIALRHADVFPAVGAFSSAPPDQSVTETAFNTPDRLNQQLALLWIGCGKKDFLFQKNEDFHTLMEKAGVKHQYVVTEGDHSWPIWRNYLVTFAPMIFRESLK